MIAFELAYEEPDSGGPMGLLINTPGTNDMLNRINSLFSAANIGFMRQQPQKGYFCGITTKKKLHEIADLLNQYPSGGKNSPEGKNWIKWLKFMHTGIKPTPAEQIQNCICDGLSDNPNCAEIFFVVVPTSSSDPTVSCSKIGDPNAYTEVITISTPTVNAIKKVIRRKASARRKGRSKKKA